MKQLQTRGIILSRTDFGEADRILTLITPENGKLRLMARGVRRAKSKLAGGIELFSISDITYIPGKGEIGTLISSRLVTHYGRIVTDIERVQLGYDLIKLLNKATEDQPEPEYYDLLEHALQSLNDTTIDLHLIRLWFEAQLLRLNGHAPNLHTDVEGSKLQAEAIYNFDFDNMAFIMHTAGGFTAAHIKMLRLLFSGHQPAILNQVQNLRAVIEDVAPVIRTMRSSFIRV